MRRKRIWFSLVILFSLFSSTPAWQQEIRNLQKVRIGIPTRGAALFPVIVAQSHGFYRAEAMDVELILMSPGTTLQALVAGSVDYAMPFSSGARAAITGMPVRIVWAGTTGPNHTLVVKPEIRRMEDLKGKTLGVAGVRDLTDIGTRLALRKHKLDADADVKIVNVRESGSRLTSLQSGGIDGSFLPVPYNKVAVKLGFRELVSLKDVIGVPTLGFATTLQKIQFDPESIVAILRATSKATRFLKNNRGEFLKLLEKESGIKDEKVASLIYEDALDNLSDTGIPSEAAMLETVASIKEAARITRDVSMAEVFDFSFARKALK